MGVPLSGCEDPLQAAEYTPDDAANAFFYYVPLITTPDPGQEGCEYIE